MSDVKKIKDQIDVSKYHRSIARIEKAGVRMGHDGAFLQLFVQFHHEDGFHQCLAGVALDEPVRDGADNFVERRGTAAAGQVIRMAAEMWGSIEALQGKTVYVYRESSGFNASLVGFGQMPFDGDGLLILPEVFRVMGGTDE